MKDMHSEPKKYRTFFARDGHKSEYLRKTHKNWWWSALTPSRSRVFPNYYFFTAKRRKLEGQRDNRNGTNLRRLETDMDKYNYLVRSKYYFICTK